MNNFHPINEIYNRSELREDCTYEGPGLRPYIVKCGILHVKTKTGLKKLIESEKHKNSKYLRVK